MTSRAIPSRGTVVRFTPDRSASLARQQRILHATAFIEVPQHMYRRDTLNDLE